MMNPLYKSRISPEEATAELNRMACLKKLTNMVDADVPTDIALTSDEFDAVKYYLEMTLELLKNKKNVDEFKEIIELLEKYKSTMSKDIRLIPSDVLSFLLVQFGYSIIEHDTITELDCSRKNVKYPTA